MRAFFNITTNRLTLDPSRRLTEEEYATAKALKFQWYPGRKIFSGIWSPDKEDFLLSMAGTIEEDDTPDDVEARAQRFQKYAQRHEQDAEDAAARSQTANTERRQRLAAGRAEREHSAAQYWQERTAAAIRHADRKDSPGVIMRRIEGLEKDLRIHMKNGNILFRYIAAWSDTEKELTRERAAGILNHGGIYQGQLPPRAGESFGRSLWRSVADGETPPEQAREIALEALTKQQDHARRWVEHLTRRLEYENAYLAAVGGDTRSAVIEKGNYVQCRWGRCKVLKVNKKTVDVLASFGKEPRGVRVQRNTITEVYTA